MREGLFSRLCADSCRGSIHLHAQDPWVQCFVVKTLHILFAIFVVCVISLCCLLLTLTNVGNYKNWTMDWTQLWTHSLTAKISIELS